MIINNREGGKFLGTPPLKRKKKMICMRKSETQNVILKTKY